MSTTVNATDLHAALKKIMRAMDRKPNIPVLRCARLESTPDGELALTCTDLDRDYTARAAASGAADLHAAPDAKDLLTALEGVTGAITLAVAGESLTVETEAGGAIVECLPVEDFPRMKDTWGDLAQTITMPAPELARVLGTVAPAMSTEETRYYLDGVLFELPDYPDGRDSEPLTVVATDGRRLARVRTEHIVPPFMTPENASGGRRADVIAPRAFIKDALALAKAREHKAATAHLRLSETRVAVTIGGVTMTSKVIDGVFPEYTRVIPSRQSEVAAIPAKALIAAVKAVSAVSSERTKVAKLTVDGGGGRVEASNPDGASAWRAIPGAYHEGEGIVTGFNARYLLDTAGAFPTGATLRMSQASPYDPARIESNDAPDVTVVVMPMRV